MNRRLYAIHRWLSAIALVQLAAWTLSGLFFAVVPSTTLKGSPVEHANEATLDADLDVVPPSRILKTLEPRGHVSKLTLAGAPAGVFYTATVGSARVRLDARTGAERPVDANEAAAAARRDQPSAPPVVSTEVVASPPPLEYRDKPLPAWRVTLADGRGTVVYVDAVTAEVTARRNDVWRVYDFLWALHIMDYRGREDFRHPLLVAAASLGLLTVASGCVLWGTRLVRRWRGRRKTFA